ncbi:hypothetical protein ACOME3_001423 [Neoechinorhynchus agilis]
MMKRVSSSPHLEANRRSMFDYSGLQKRLRAARSGGFFEDSCRLLMNSEHSIDTLRDICFRMSQISSDDPVFRTEREHLLRLLVEKESSLKDFGESNQSCTNEPPPPPPPSIEQMQLLVHLRGSEILTIKDEKTADIIIDEDVRRKLGQCICAHLERHRPFKSLEPNEKVLAAQDSGKQEDLLHCMIAENGIAPASVSDSGKVYSPVKLSSIKIESWVIRILFSTKSIQKTRTYFSKEFQHKDTDDIDCDKYVDRFAFDKVDTVTYIHFGRNVSRHVDRTSCMGPLEYDKSGLPLNKAEKTGYTGLGRLWRFGPNHLSIFIITRSFTLNTLECLIDKGEPGNIRRLPEIRNEIFNGNGSLPDRLLGDICRNVTDERGSGEDAEATSQRIHVLNCLRRQKPEIVHEGYLEDARNTDNAWIEATIYRYKDDPDNVLSLVQFRHPKSTLEWMKVSDCRRKDACLTLSSRKLLQSL